MQVERVVCWWQHLYTASGERVSNAWVICLKDWDNSSKEVLIPDGLYLSYDLYSKGSRKASALR